MIASESLEKSAPESHKIFILSQLSFYKFDEIEVSQSLQQFVSN